MKTEYRLSKDVNYPILIWAVIQTKYPKIKDDIIVQIVARFRTRSDCRFFIKIKKQQQRDPHLELLHPCMKLKVKHSPS